jgi:hypothetical protein
MAINIKTANRILAVIVGHSSRVAEPKHDAEAAIVPPPGDELQRVTRESEAGLNEWSLVQNKRQFDCPKSRLRVDPFELGSR